MDVRSNSSSSLAVSSVKVGFTAALISAKANNSDFLAYCEDDDAELSGDGVHT